MTKSILYSHDSHFLKLFKFELLLFIVSCLNCWLICFWIVDYVVYCLFTGVVLECCQLVFESSEGGASFCGESEEFFAIYKWVSIAFLILFVMLEQVESRTTWWVKAIQSLSQSTFSLFIIRRTRDRFEFERTRGSFWGYPVSKWANMLATCHINLLASIV